MIIDLDIIVIFKIIFLQISTFDLMISNYHILILKKNTR